MASTLPVAEQSTAPGDMQLLAAGFNAWGQLQLSPSTSGRNEEPEDIFEFTLVLQDSQIGRPLAQLTSTLCMLSFLHWQGSSAGRVTHSGLYSQDGRWD